MKALFAALLLSLLSGCASVRLIDAQVQSHASAQAGAAIAPGARYRFDRLPSQAGQQERTEKVEALAEQALAGVGLLRDDAAARYSVQIGVRVESFLVDAWGRPMTQPWNIHGQFMLGAGNGSWFGLGLRNPPPTHYRREISLLIRDLNNGQLVYETRAGNDSPWSDNSPILGALFEAALRDFPQPPAGTRRIDIEIPR